MKHFYVIFGSIFLLFLFLSCQKDLTPEPDSTSDIVCIIDPGTGTGGQTASSGTITVGQRLANPYTLYHMQEAVASIKMRIGPSFTLMTNMLGNDLGKVWDVMAMTATHYHVKITPRTLDDLAFLEEDPDLDLSPYPLDSEIIGEGTMPYVASTLNPETGEETLNASLQPLYAIIPVSKQISPRIPYQILNELYVPPVEGSSMTDTRSTGYTVSQDFSDMLVNQSMYLLGYEYFSEWPESRGSKWYPSGSIKVYDSHLKRSVGVPHAKVKAHNWWGIGDWAYTDENGDFYIPRSFRNAVRYKIKWEDNRYWDIRDAGHGQAVYHGPKQKAAWHLNIPKDSKIQAFANITRALSSHFYGENPFDKSITSHKIKLQYRHENNPNAAGYFSPSHVGGIGKTIRIYGLYSNQNIYNSDVFINTTFHELGHSAMYHKCKKLNISYQDFDKIIRESWASMVDWYMTKKEYEKFDDQTLFTYQIYHTHTDLPDRIFENYNHMNLQSTTQNEFILNKNNKGVYTPLFIDLVDDSNQSLYFKMISSDYKDQVFPDDEICIKNLTLLQNILYLSKDLRSLKANCMLSRGDGPPPMEWIVNTYFEFYGV